MIPVLSIVLPMKCWCSNMKKRILLENIRSLQNVGAIFRNADGAGFEKIILTGYTPTPPRNDIAKTAL